MRLNHELYNAGHFFEFAVALHQLNGSTKALDAAKRFADHIDDTFGPGKRYEVGGYIYAHSDERLFVNLFAAGEGTVTMNKDTVVKITQQTD